MAEIENIDSGIFKPTLEQLLQKTSNLLEREWPVRYRQIPNAQIIFETRMKISINTYNAILTLTATTPPDPLRKPLLFAAAPMVRTLFEELATLLFMFHDLPNIVVSYIMTGYTEIWIERREAQKHYSHIPKWQIYISELDKQLDNLAKSLNLTPEQTAHPIKYIGRWPTPGAAVRILKVRYKSSRVIPFMEFLNAWMYRTLSGESHLSFRAIHRRGINFTPKFAKQLFGDAAWESRLKSNAQEYFKDITWATFTLLLSILSEINNEFGYDMKDRLHFLWTIFVAHSDMAKDFYEMRYEALLT
jgi:hypothetical protein